MKRKKINIAFSILVVVAMIGLIGFYVYEVVYKKIPYDTNLYRMLAVVFGLLATLVRINKGRRKTLAIYEKAYENEIGYAFKNKPIQRKKLLCACRLFDESNYKKALKYLFQLLNECEFDRDTIPVLLFIALCYEDAGCIDDAISGYYELLKVDPDNAQVHNNLGGLFIKYGDFESALKHYNKSIEIMPDYYYAYVSRANYYFRTEEYDNAIDDAKKALELKNNGVEAASLLTIIYALMDDEENKKKYYHLSITSGKHPQDLNEAVNYFMSEKNTETEETVQ